MADDFDYTKCKHTETVVLAGRKVCNSGCGADLGPANPTPQPPST